MNIILPSVFLGFLAFGIFLPWFRTKKLSEFLILSRQLTLFPFIASLVSTAYGWVLGIGEMYDQYGPMAWFILSFPYSAFTLVLALGLGQKLRKQEVASVPALMKKSYGSPFGIFTAFLLLLFLSPAMYFLMTSRILQRLYGLPESLSLALSIGISVLYLFSGGFKSVVNSDKIQFLLMFLGFGSMALWFIFYPVPPLEQSPLIGKFQTITWQEWIFWFSAAAITLADPNFHQRIQALKSPKLVRKGLLWCVFFWTVFDALACWIVYNGRLVFPEANGGDEIYLLFMKEGVPELLSGIWAVGLLATTISTANSFTFTGAQSLSQDIYASHKEIPKYVHQLSIVVVVIFSALLSWMFSEKSIVDMFYSISPVVLSVILWPLIICVYRQINVSKFAMLITSILVAMGTLSWELFSIDKFTSLNSFIGGIIISFVGYGILFYTKLKFI